MTLTITGKSCTNCDRSFAQLLLDRLSGVSNGTSLGMLRELVYQILTDVLHGRTILSSAGNDGRVRLWKATAGKVWRPAGHISVEQAEEQRPDVEMDENAVAD